MKTMMILGFVLCSAIAIALLLPALRRRQADSAELRLAQNAEAYRTRKTELDADLAAGRIDEPTYEALEADAARMLLAADTSVDRARSGSRWPIVAGISAVPVLAAGLYLAGGGLPPLTNNETADAMLLQLEERLAANPSDVEGWFVLGRSRMVTQEYTAAAAAFAKANELTNQRAPELLVAEGEALAFARDNDLLGRPRQLFTQALAANPDHLRALWYSAQANLQADEPAEAIAQLQRLETLNIPPALAQAVSGQLAQLGAAPMPSAAPADAAEQGGVAIPVRVERGADVQIPEGGVLFVFAQLPDGPPMPLAVRRLGAPEFPANVTLRESDAMMPNLSLSSAQRWKLTARVSASGTATPQPGDAQGSRVVTEGDWSESQPVVLTIDTIVE